MYIHMYTAKQRNKLYITVELKSKTKRNYNNKIANKRRYKHIHTFIHTHVCTSSVKIFSHKSQTQRDWF